MHLSRPLAWLAAACIVVAGIGGVWRLIAGPDPAGATVSSTATALTVAVVVCVVAGLAALGVRRARRRSTPYW